MLQISKLASAGSTGHGYAAGVIGLSGKLLCSALGVRNAA
jgi:hypothetical protein